MEPCRNPDRMDEYNLWQTIGKVPGLMQSDECMLLYRLAEHSPAGGWLVELGTFKGRGAAVLALSEQGKVITIDDYSYEVESSPMLVAANLKAVGLSATIIEGDSATVPCEVDKVSLLLVDTEHTRDRFRQEMEAWLPLMMPSGIIACHDFNSSKWPEITKAVREFLPDWARLQLTRKLVGLRRAG